MPPVFLIIGMYFFSFFSGLIHTESSNISQFLVIMLQMLLINERIKIVKTNLIKYYAKFYFVAKLPCDNMAK